MGAGGGPRGDGARLKGCQVPRETPGCHRAPPQPPVVGVPVSPHGHPLVRAGQEQVGGIALVAAASPQCWGGVPGLPPLSQPHLPPPHCPPLSSPQLLHNCPPALLQHSPPSCPTMQNPKAQISDHEGWMELKPAWFCLSLHPRACVLLVAPFWFLLSLCQAFCHPWCWFAGGLCHTEAGQVSGVLCSAEPCLHREQPRGRWLLQVGEGDLAPLQHPRHSSGRPHGAGAGPAARAGSG